MSELKVTEIDEASKEWRAMLHEAACSGRLAIEDKTLMLGARFHIESLALENARLKAEFSVIRGDMLQGKDYERKLEAENARLKEALRHCLDTLNGIFGEGESDG